MAGHGDRPGEVGTAVQRVGDHARARVAGADFDENADAFAIGRVEHGREIERVQQSGGDRFGGIGASGRVRTCPSPTEDLQAGDCHCGKGVQLPVSLLDRFARFAVRKRDAAEREECLAQRFGECRDIGPQAADNALRRRVHDEQERPRAGAEVRPHVVRRRGQHPRDPVDFVAVPEFSCRVVRRGQIGFEQARSTDAAEHFVAVEPNAQPEETRRFAEAQADGRIRVHTQ